MKNKKILILFLFLVAGLTIVSWFVIQNSWTKKYLNLYVTKLVAPYGVSLSIGSVVPTYRLGARISQVKLKYQKEFNINLQAVDVDIDFNLLSVFSRKIKIKKLSLKHSRLVVKQDKPSVVIDEKQFDTIKMEIISKKIREIITLLPVFVEKIEIEDMQISTAGKTITLPSFFVMMSTKKVEAKGVFDHITLGKYGNVDGGKLHVTLEEQKLKINSIQLYQGTNIVDIAGYAFSSDRFSCHINGRGELANLLTSFMSHTYVTNGKYKVDLDMVKEDSKPIGVKGRIAIGNLQTPWAYFKQVDVEIEKQKNILLLKQIIAKDWHEGKLSKIGNPIALYDFSSSSVLINQILLKVDSAYLANLLRSVHNPDKLKLWGNISTDNVKLTWNNHDLTIISDKKIVLSKLKLNTLLSFKYPGVVSDFKLKIPFSGSGISLTGQVQMNKTKFKVNALFKPKESFVKLGKLTAELADIDHISSVGIRGHVQGNLLFQLAKSNQLKISLSGSNVDILGFHLGEVHNANLEYSFDENSLALDFRQAKIGGALYNTNGIFYFDHSLRHKSILKIDVIKARVRDVIHVLENKISIHNLQLFKNIHGGLKGKVIYRNLVKGYGLDLSAFSKRLLVGSEQFSNFSLLLEKKGDVYSCRKFSLYKGHSRLKFSGLVDFKQQSFAYKLHGDPVSINSFSVIPKFLEQNVDGKISIDAKGEGRFSDFSTSTIVKMKRCHIGKVVFDDSRLAIDSMGKELFVSADIGGKQILSNLYLNLNPKQNKRSLFDLKISIDQLRKYLLILNPNLQHQKDITGEAYLSMQADFLPTNFQSLNMKIKLDKFYNRVGNSFLQLDKPSVFLIKNGKANNQEISLWGNHSSFKLFANGTIAKDFLLTAKGEAQLDWLSVILSQFVERVGGETRGSLEWKIGSGKHQFDYQIHGQNISFVSLNQKLHFDKIKFDVEQNNNKIFLKNLSGQLNQGKIMLTGTAALHLKKPVVKFSYSLDKIRVAPLANTTIFASSTGVLQGDKLPLLLKGTIRIDSGIVKSELSDVVKKNQMGDYDKSFLPSIIRVQETPLVVLQMKYNFLNPVKIQNSLVDMQLTGTGVVKGSYNNLIPIGKIEIIPHVSKFLFKGNDFKIKRGEIFFDNKEGEGAINPRFNIRGDAQVGKYLITAELKGDAVHPVTELHSEPALAQSDILSILMIGFTSQEVTNIDEKERELATSVGIGAMFAEQLKLGKELNNMFGVKLSIMPEISDSSVDYVSAISSTGNGAKTKTSTKIELKKKLREDVELSFSSTVGGSSEQIQKININYNIKPNLSLEGVYEIREEGDGNRISSPESVGVDLKMNLDFE